MTVKFDNNTPEWLIATAIERLKYTRMAALEDVARAQARIAACDEDLQAHEIALAKLTAGKEPAA